MVADVVVLTYIVVVETLPEVCVNDNEEPKLLPDVVEISYPVGAEIDISFVKNVPDTVNDCSAEFTPVHAVKVFKVPVVVIVGATFGTISPVLKIDAPAE